MSWRHTDEELEGHQRSRSLRRRWVIPLLVVSAAALGAVEPAKPAAEKKAPVASWDDATCLTCHAKLVTRKFKHSSLKDGSCADCHAPTPFEGECKSKVGTRWRLTSPEPKLCADCHDKTGDTPLHHIIDVKGCSACHDAHGSDVKKNLKLPKAELCLRCHQRPDEGRVVHQPVKDGDCVGCHEPHSGVEAPLLKETKKDLCEECHPAKELSKKSHEQAAKTCLECHAPHSSNTKGLLRDPPAPPKPKQAPKDEEKEKEGASYDDAPCQTCHSKLLEKKYKHGIFKGGVCGDCHVPSEEKTTCKKPVAQGWRLVSRDPELCASCHDKTGDTPLHKIIGLRGCQACHDPHASDVKKLLKAPEKQLCETCHKKKDQKGHTHTAVTEGKCSGCHEPHSGVEKPLLRETRKALCDECHDKPDVQKGPEVHTAVKEGRCLECHDPHGSDVENNLVAEKGAPLCLKCHDAKKPARSVLGTRRVDLEKKVVHKAIPDKGCQGCHVTEHSAAVPKLLKKPKPELCADCHDKKDGHAQTHGAVKQGECTLCHAPHSADEPKLLRSKSTQALCFQCHEDDVTGRAFVHAPVAKGYCLRCHDPHGSEKPKNLVVTKGQDGCLDCHAQKVAPKVTHVALDRYGCVACHDPHGTANPFQLIRPVNELCSDCHKQQADGDHVGALGKTMHAVSGAWDARRGRAFTCASCHDPHGGQNAKLFYFGNERLEMCDGCHGDHSGQHPELVDLSKRQRNGFDGGVGSLLVPPSMLTLPGSLEPLPPRPDAGVAVPDAGVPPAKVSLRPAAAKPRPIPRRSSP